MVDFEKVVKVEIRNNITGERTEVRAFPTPEPGIITVWDFRTPFMSNDISVTVEWSKKNV